MKWLAWLCWDPSTALDWRDAGDPTKMDHGKVVADLIIFSLLAATLAVSLTTHAFPPAYLVLALIAGGMGSRVFMALIRSKSIQSTENVTVALGRRPLARKIDDPDQTQS